MKIKRYRIKPGITLDALKIHPSSIGGSYINKNAVLSISKALSREISVNIAFPANLKDWNDFDYVLVLDEDFGQPYSPFYGKNYGKDIINFPTLENCIKEYNEYMDSLDFLEEI